MIDAPKALRDALLSVAAVSAEFGTRIYPESPTPPNGYKPSIGTCLCFKARGGQPHPHTDAVLRPSVQFKLYGATEIDAQRAYRVLFDALRTLKTTSVMGAEAETLGTTLREPDTGWVFVLAFYRLTLANP
jgi:hypothetical protein